METATVTERKAALRILGGYGLSAPEVECDSDCKTARAVNGAWVQVWVWVPDEKDDQAVECKHCPSNAVASGLCEFHLHAAREAEKRQRELEEQTVV